VSLLLNAFDTSGNTPTAVDGGWSTTYEMSWLLSNSCEGMTYTKETLTFFRL